MNITRILGIIALVLGALSVIYGGFSYTKESTVAKVGPVELKAAHDKRVNIPLWAGIAIFAVGGGLLFVSGRK
jgi:hypothetical protein